MAFVTPDVDKGWEINRPTHKRLYLKAEPFLRVRDNTLHARICYHFALKLLEEEGGDPQVVIPAILLHDVGYSKIPEEALPLMFGPQIKDPEITRFHEIEGAKLAGEILQALDYADKVIKEIQRIIDGHDTRDTALSLNDKIVKDSDKLWRFSAEGFVIDAKRFNFTRREWLDYLTVRIPSWFFTETAKELAAEEAAKREEELQKDCEFIHCRGLSRDGELEEG